MAERAQVQASISLSTLEETFSGLQTKTPLLRAVSLSELVCSEVHLKLESANPTGTHKDRAALMNIAFAINSSKDTVTAGTCGNYGAALAFYAQKMGLRAVIYIPAGYSGERVSEMISHGAEIVPVPGHYEDAVRASALAARKNGWHDANPGGLGGYLSMVAYASIAYEIVDQLGTVPDEVYLPVGNGTTLAGVWLGFRRLLTLGRADKLPRIVGVTTRSGNPVLRAFEMGLSKVSDLRPEEIVETPVNEPLVSYHSYEGQQALEAVLESWGEVLGFSDWDMVVASRMLRLLEGVEALPASASVLLAALKRPPASEREVRVLIITGGPKSG